VPVWTLDRAPQTRAKLRVLADYLRAWVTVIKDHFAIGYYVDGFAGAGEYDCHGVRVLGSPGIAVLAGTRAAEQAARKGRSFELRCRFIEADAETCESLRSAARQWPGCDIAVYGASFEDRCSHVMAEIGEERSRRRSRVASFFFVDPFGISGLPLSLVRGVVGQLNTETLVNYNLPSVRRHIGLLTKQPPDDPQYQSAHAKLTRVFGGEDWWPAWDRATPGQRELELLDLYKARLPARFVQELRMTREAGGVLMYYLLHTTHNATGARIVRDIFRREETAETLFAPPPVAGCKATLRERYKGQAVARSTIRNDMCDANARVLNQALGELLVDGYAAAPTWGLSEDEEYTFFE